MNNRKVERISPPREGGASTERPGAAVEQRLGSWSGLGSCGCTGVKGHREQTERGPKTSEAQTSSVSSSTPVYESQRGASRASRASTTAARLQLTPPQPRVADGATPTSTSTPVCKEEVQETGGGAEDRCRGPDVPRRSHMKENTGGKGRMEAEREERRRNQVRNTEANIWRSLVTTRKRQLEEGSRMKRHASSPTPRGGAHGYGRK